jgi:DNA methylase
LQTSVKPVPSVADAIKDCIGRNDLILDPFAGNGTVLIAAERADRTPGLRDLRRKDGIATKLVTRDLYQSGRIEVLAALTERRPSEPSGRREGLS